MISHAERQKLLNRLNLINETLCDVLDQKIVIMGKEKVLRREEVLVKELLAADEEKE
jgi:cell shape-determining protein MreC